MAGIAGGGVIDGALVVGVRALVTKVDLVTIWFSMKHMIKCFKKALDGVII